MRNDQGSVGDCEDDVHEHRNLLCGAHAVGFGPVDPEYPAPVGPAQFTRQNQQTTHQADLPDEGKHACRIAGVSSRCPGMTPNWRLRSMTVAELSHCNCPQLA